jgi:hypothetical protein
MPSAMRALGRHPRILLAVGLSALVAAAAFAPALFRSRLDEVRAATGLTHCDETRPSRDPRTNAWGAAVETETDACAGVGPLFTYARFRSARDLRSTLLRDPPPAGLCVIEPTEVVVTDLLDGSDAAACHRLHGDVVSRTEHVTPALGLSMDEIDRSSARFDRQASAAMRRALRRHWRRHPLPGRP